MQAVRRLLVACATIVLLALSAPPGKARAAPRVQQVRPDAALAELRACFPELKTMVAGRRLLDFGSGEGMQAVALAQCGAREVVGVEINPAGRARGAELAALHGVADRVRFVNSVDEVDGGGYDACISLNSMEHFDQPLLRLQEMRACLRPGGLLLVTFAPPWYAPYGAHMAYFTKVPWVHLLFPEEAVMAARSRYRSDGARRYEDVPGGLNRMSVARFERLVEAAGLEVVARRDAAVRGVPGLTRLPLLRELATNRVTAVLRVPECADTGEARRGLPASAGSLVAAPCWRSGQDARAAGAGPGRATT